MKIKKEISLSDVVDFFKKNNVPTFEEEIDRYAGYFITAARIAAVILAPDPITKIGAFCAGNDAASLKVSSLFSWLPDKFKYKDKGREILAIQRYELSAYVNFLLLQIAISNGVKDVFMPYISNILKGVELDDRIKAELKLKCEDKHENLKLSINYSLSLDDITSYSSNIVEPILSMLLKASKSNKVLAKNIKKNPFDKVKNGYIEKINLHYQAFLIHFSKEFPEFILWIDIVSKERIITELKNSINIITEDKKEHKQLISQTEELINRIDKLRKNSFIKESGFPSFIETYKEMFEVHESHISDIVKEQNDHRTRVIDNIMAHQNHIKAELGRPLSDNKDVEHIIYPQNKDIYISQSFEAITYKNKIHKKGFLTTDSLGEEAEKGENIGNYLLQTLVNPNYATKPIILLGNPGAGKSMLSKMFTGLLCETNDFIPFLVKLRNVASSSGNISEHINKGLANSIDIPEINWLEWAKEFKDRTPVIILDGFDELMQTSNRELNDYVNKICEFQEKAIYNDICVRVILTSRITVMQDVYIPEDSKIIKLNSFDNKRQDLWLKKWNGTQNKKKYRFIIPKNDKIELLAKEPLLLFMLAIYDFENSELQMMASDKSFNQSKLYDSLLNKFIKRQLDKNDYYKRVNGQAQRQEEELFRLRLGMIALMMFLNDTTSRDTQRLYEEITAFGIENPNMPNENILGGFFFIHENKSTTEGNTEKLNYEFLHKTFSEFLTADFILRVAGKQYCRILGDQSKISQKEIFNLCFGYNWLHKHNNIQNFLFEHAKQIIKPNTPESNYLINGVVKPDIRNLFDKVYREFPVTAITKIDLLEEKSAIEYLGIYSQNLMLLWLAVSENENGLIFNIIDLNQNIEMKNEPKYESQDREETNKNKNLWKRLTKLWTLVGNNVATAKLSEWTSVQEEDEYIILKRGKSEIKHNYSNSAIVACNDFEFLLSIFDRKCELLEEYEILKTIKKIINKKPEFTILAVDAVLYRFSDFYFFERFNFINWFKNVNLNERQQIAFLKNIESLSSLINNPLELRDIIETVSDIISTCIRSSKIFIEYLKTLNSIQYYTDIKYLFDYERFEKSYRVILRDIDDFDRKDIFLAFENLKVLLDFSKRFSYKIPHFDEFVYRLTTRIFHRPLNDSYSELGYLKILNELIYSYPTQKIFRHEFYDDLIQKIIKEFTSRQGDNPEIIIEYLRLFYNFKIDKYYSKAPNKVLVKFLESLSNNKNNIWGYRKHLDVDILKMLVEFQDIFPIEKLVPDELLSENFYRYITDEFAYRIRKNSKEAKGYLKILIFFNKNNPQMKYSVGDFFEETLDRIIHEVGSDFYNDYSSYLTYLEFLFMTSNWSKYENIIERLIILSEKELKERDLDMIILSLLIKYNAPSDLITYSMRRFPNLMKVYTVSPEIARDMIEATKEINNYERYY